MPQLNVGLLGFGGAGRVFHAPLISAEPRLSLHSIGSRNIADKALPAGVKGGAIAEIIDDPDVDLVVIATPNESHAPLAIQALRAGKHVVVDKPFALNSAEATSIVKVANETGKLLSVFQNRRWDGGFLTAQKSVDDGVLGPIHYGEFHFDRYSPVIRDRWREWDTPGAGILYDLGPHLLDQVHCLFGKPDAIFASLAAQRQGALVDDFFHITLEFGSTRIVAHASTLMPDHAPRIALYGSNSSFFQFGFDGQEGALKVGKRPGDPYWGETPGGSAYLMDVEGNRKDLTLLRGKYEAYYARVARAILSGADLPITNSQALDVMRMLDAANLSAKTGTKHAL